MGTDRFGLFPEGSALVALGRSCYFSSECIFKSLKYGNDIA